jgi:hypothetical protein
VQEYGAGVRCKVHEKPGFVRIGTQRHSKIATSKSVRGGNLVHRWKDRLPSQSE